MSRHDFSPGPADSPPVRTRVELDDLDAYHAMVTAMSGAHERRLTRGARFACRLEGGRVGSVGFAEASLRGRMWLRTSGDHETYFLHVPRRGVIRYELVDGISTADPRTAVLVRPGESLVSSHDAIETFVVAVGASALDGEMGRWLAGDLDAATFRRTLDMTSRAGRRLANVMVVLASSFRDRRSGLLTDRDGRSALAHLVVDSILGGFVGQGQTDDTGDRAPGRVAGERDLLAAVARHVEENLDRPLRLGDLCVVAGVPSRTLQRLCQRHWGVSPITYVSLQRLHRARRMLRRGFADMTVTEVALGCGFVHLGRFAAAYRQQFGETPSATLARARSRFS
jgi:AraC-like DNA-binding protein